MKKSGVPYSSNIPWQRFWCPLGGVIHCGDAGGGFLTEPEDEYGKHANPGVSRLATLLPEAGALVLCGEPGIGKSTELAGIREMLETAREERGEHSLWIVFRDVADAADFRRQTVDSLAWQAWRAGPARMTLVVDGVDEGLLRVPNLVNDLAAMLKSEPVARLRLMLACRTAEWPLEMGRQLLMLWPEQKPEPYYELCPLRRKDAELAATARGADAEMQQHARPFAFRAAAECWDEQLSETFAHILSRTLASKSLLNGLAELASRDRKRALKISADILATISPGALVYPIGTFAAVVSALSWGATEHWSTVYRLLEADDNLARAVCEEVCDGLGLEGKDMLSQLTEPALADFVLLLHKLFPAASDPPRPRSAFVSANEAARQTRGKLPGILAARATEAACRELLRLAAALPAQSTWLRWIYRDAVTNVRRNLWLPPAPDAVKRVLAQPGARLLHSEDDLLELVLESLARLQMRLTGRVLPAVEDLWRWEGKGNARKNFHPKDEEALSDYIARWLTDDLGPAAGVVVGREVQPRRGLRTDVIVDAAPAAAGGGFEKFTVVIEVKGCWHPKVRTALRTQLADDYLRPHGLRCGIYLVGWFVCARWENAANKLAGVDTAAARVELDALAADFADGAGDLRIVAMLMDCTF